MEGMWERRTRDAGESQGLLDHPNLGGAMVVEAEGRVAVRVVEAVMHVLPPHALPRHRRLVVELRYPLLQAQAALYRPRFPIPRLDPIRCNPHGRRGRRLPPPHLTSTRRNQSPTFGRRKLEDQRTETAGDAVHRRSAGPLGRHGYERVRVKIEGLELGGR